ncbi:MAG: c-type cytochrome [Bacteroidetes bacterium]|nr:c-type cytochrome [Bacteroidota bacterium]
MNKKLMVLLLICSGIILFSCKKLFPPEPPGNEVLAAPMEGLTKAQLASHAAGDELFAKIYTQSEGLGPIFIQSSCEGCHVGDGKGHPFTMVTRFARLTQGTIDYMEDLGGPQVQNRALSGYVPEGVHESADFVSQRLAPLLTGLGFLAAVHDSTIINMALKMGKVNWVEPPDYFVPTADHISVAGRFVGRFGKKAKEIRIFDQVVFALKEDIGITSDFDLEDPFNHLVGNNTGDNVADPEVGKDVINNLVFYLRTLKAPERRNIDDPDVIAGEKLFADLGCINCHKPTLKTAKSDIAVLSEVEFHPFTDLLIHDMGDDLDDGFPEGSATGSEWRTPPLWGLGLAKDVQGGERYLLHDGSASTIDEVLKVHGGEAMSASAAFFSLSEEDHDKVITFLNSL